MYFFYVWVSTRVHCAVVLLFFWGLGLSQSHTTLDVCYVPEYSAQYAKLLLYWGLGVSKCHTTYIVQCMYNQECALTQCTKLLLYWGLSVSQCCTSQYVLNALYWGFVQCTVQYSKSFVQGNWGVKVPDYSVQWAKLLLYWGLGVSQCHTTHCTVASTSVSIVQCV